MEKLQETGKDYKIDFLLRYGNEFLLSNNPLLSGTIPTELGNSVNLSENVSPDSVCTYNPIHLSNFHCY